MVEMRFHYSRIKNILYHKFKEKPWFLAVLSYTLIRFHSIESRMIETFRYVDCNPENYDVFSYEYASILRDSGSVFGSIMDRLVRETSSQPTEREYNMGDYRKWLIKEVENVHLVSVGLVYPVQQRFLLPFHQIEQENERLEWWTAYNNVKHIDISKFKDGNLGNTLHSIGALAVLYAVMDKNNGSQIRLFDEIGFRSPMRNLAEVFGRPRS